MHTFASPGHLPLPAAALCGHLSLFNHDLSSNIPMTPVDMALEAPLCPAGRMLLQRMAWVCAVMVLLIMSLSAYLRLSKAGLGCEPWPQCYGQALRTPQRRMPQLQRPMAHGSGTPGPPGDCLGGAGAGAGDGDDGPGLAPRPVARGPPGAGAAGAGAVSGRARALDGAGAAARRDAGQPARGDCPVCSQRAPGHGGGARPGAIRGPRARRPPGFGWRSCWCWPR